MTFDCMFFLLIPKIDIRVNIWDEHLPWYGGTIE